MKFNCCNFEQEPDYTFEIDNGTLFACYCGICEGMVTLGYTTSSEYKKDLVISQLDSMHKLFCGMANGAGESDYERFKQSFEVVKKYIEENNANR